MELHPRRVPRLKYIGEITYVSECTVVGSYRSTEGVYKKGYLVLKLS